MPLSHIILTASQFLHYPNNATNPNNVPHVYGATIWVILRNCVPNLWFECYIVNDFAFLFGVVSQIVCAESVY